LNMSWSFELERINQLVLNKQHLTDESRVDNVVQVVKDMFVGILQQNFRSFGQRNLNNFTRGESYWSLGLRKTRTESQNISIRKGWQERVLEYLLEGARDQKIYCWQGSPDKGMQLHDPLNTENRGSSDVAS